MSEFSALGPTNHVPTAAYGFASIERLEKAFCLWMNIGEGPFRFRSLFSAFPRVVFFRGENIMRRSFEGITCKIIGLVSLVVLIMVACFLCILALFP